MHNLIKLTHVANGYYCALLKDYQNPEHITLQMRRNLDCLDPEVWQYLGRRVTTKKHAEANKIALLEAINTTYNSSFTRLTID